MNDEINVNTTETQATPATAKPPTEHFYYEIGGELLDKTKALCNIIESEKARSVLVFCNTLADTDLVEVLLKKRGLQVAKLAQDLPRARVQLAKLVKETEGLVVVTTDQAAQGIELGSFALVINYSVHTDPEIYLHRSGVDDLGGRPDKVVSLVGPHDFSNFHFSKKVVGFPITKAELPTDEVMIEAKFATLSREAATGSHLTDALVLKYQDLLEKSANRSQILGLLIHNTMNVIPSLKKADVSRVAPIAVAKTSVEKAAILTTTTEEIAVADHAMDKVADETRADGTMTIKIRLTVTTVQEVATRIDP